MTVQRFEPSTTGMGRQLLWRLAVLAAFLGLALTQTTPSVEPNQSAMLTGSLATSTQVTVPVPLNLTITISKETNSSLTTTDMTNGTSNGTTERSMTSALMTSPLTTAITESSPTTVSIATTQRATTPEQQTTKQTKTTPAPPKPKPTKHQRPATTESGRLTPTGRPVPPGPTNNVALYLLLPLVVIAGIAMLVMIISYLRKRIRLDKLRHQLLPLYNFDPQEGEDWETELLTEPRPSSQTPLNATKPKPTTTAVAEIPKLRFSPDTVDV